jgi:hypothetical protein
MIDKSALTIHRESFSFSFAIIDKGLGIMTDESGKSNNAVIARDFVPSFHENKNLKLTGAFQRVNEQLDHLAKNRAHAQKFSLNDAQEIVNWLGPVMRKFIQSLSSEQRQQWNTPSTTVSNLSTSNHTTSISWAVGRSDDA